MYKYPKYLYIYVCLSGCLSVYLLKLMYLFIFKYINVSNKNAIEQLHAQGQVRVFGPARFR